MTTLSKRTIGVLGAMLLTAFVFVTGCEQSTGGGGPAAYTVTFNANAGSDTVTGLPAPITGVASGAKITEPAAGPARSGYNFLGWYTEAACATEWVFATNTVTADITLYAKWESLADAAKALRDAINAIQADSAKLTTETGSQVELLKDVTLTGALEVPDGAVLDLKGDYALTLGNSAVLTVNGEINANGGATVDAVKIKVTSVTATPATINGNGVIHLRSQGYLIYHENNGRSLRLTDVTLDGLAAGKDGDTVDNNTALVRLGGGILSMNGSAKISGNTNTGTDYSGGGVWFNSTATLTMTENASISGNTTNSGGGGVQLWGSSPVLTMSGNASITGNTAYSAGGVYFRQSGTFTMSGSASIAGNTATYGYGGVCFAGGTFTMEGGTIYGNAAVDTTAGANANTAPANRGSVLYMGSGTAQYGKPGAYTAFTLDEDSGKGTSKTLMVNPDTGALTTRP